KNPGPLPRFRPSPRGIPPRQDGGRARNQRGLTQLDTRDARVRVEKAAGALGVPATGRSELQLKLDIARAVDRASDDQVVSAAQAMNVYSSGADVIRLKEQIIKALNV